MTSIHRSVIAGMIAGCTLAGSASAQSLSGSPWGHGTTLSGFAGVAADSDHAGSAVGTYRYKALGDRDFYLSAFLDKDEAQANGVTHEGDVPIGASGAFQWLWGKATEELARGRP